MASKEINKIGFMMEQALAAMSGTLAKKLKAADIDLPHSQYAVMRVIYGSEESISQIQISEILKKDAAAIKRTLDILERKGYIVRKALDGRTNMISCTPEALKIKDQLIAIADTTLQDIFSDFSEEEVKQLYQMLTKIANHDKKSHILVRIIGEID